VKALKRRRTRLRIAATYVIVCLLAVTLILDLPRLLRPGAVTTLAPTGTADATQTSEHGWRWLNDSVMKTILNAVIPGLAGGNGGETADNDRVSALFSLLTGATPRDPKTLLSMQIPLLAGVVMPTADDEQPTATPGDGTTTPADDPVEPPETGEPTTPVEPEAPTQPEVVTPADRDPVVSGKPIIAVYATHSRESYLPEVRKINPKAVAADAFSRNMDLTTMALGTELAKTLSDRYSIGSVMSQTVHDATSRGGAYVQSLKTAQTFLKTYPTIKLICDVHRDSALHSATTVRIDGLDTARILLVVGSNQTLKHPNWKKNYDFAKTIAAKMEKMYPGLSRGVVVKTDRFNQHVSAGSLIYEIGGVDNTLEEGKRSVRLLAAVLADLVKNKQYPK
jgi:stage II sporulation protein P